MSASHQSSRVWDLPGQVFQVSKLREVLPCLKKQNNKKHITGYKRVERQEKQIGGLQNYGMTPLTINGVNFLSIMTAKSWRKNGKKEVEKKIDNSWEDKKGRTTISEYCSCSEERTILGLKIVRRFRR